MKSVSISAKVTSLPAGAMNPATVEGVSLPENLAEMTGMFGEEAVFGLAEDQLVIKMQRVVQTFVKKAAKVAADAPDRDAQLAAIQQQLDAAVKAYKPGARAPREPKKPESIEDIIKKVSGRSDEERKQLIQALRELAAKK